MNYEIKDWPDREGYWWLKDYLGMGLMRAEKFDGGFRVLEEVPEAEWLEQWQYDGVKQPRFAWLGEKFPEEDQS